MFPGSLIFPARIVSWFECSSPEVTPVEILTLTVAVAQTLRILMPSAISHSLGSKRPEDSLAYQDAFPHASYRDLL